MVYSLIAYKSKYERNAGIYRVYNISIYNREKAYIEYIRVYVYVLYLIFLKNISIKLLTYI